MQEKCFSVADPQPLRRAGAKRGPHHPKQRPLDSKTSTSTSNEVFSKLSSAHAWASVIFGGWGGGGHDSRRHSTTSFSKNVMVAETSLQMLQVLAFAIGKGLNLFPNKYNSANFSGEKRYNEACRDVYFLRIREKNVKSNLVLVVVLVFESTGVHSIHQKFRSKISEISRTQWNGTFRLYRPDPS